MDSKSVNRATEKAESPGRRSVQDPEPIAARTRRAAMKEVRSDRTQDTF